MALQLCDQVSLAGFGYDMKHPEARLHYYETIRMATMKAQVRLYYQMLVLGWEIKYFLLTYHNSRLLNISISHSKLLSVF